MESEKAVNASADQAAADAEKAKRLVNVSLAIVKAMADGGVTIKEWEHLKQFLDQRLSMHVAGIMVGDCKFQ